MARATLPAAFAAAAVSAAFLLATMALHAGDAAAQLAPPAGAPPGHCCAAGSADGQFSAPEGVEINRAPARYGGGMILVADTGNHRIQAFHPNGTFAFKFGSHGDADGEFDSPRDVDQSILRASRGLIAIADTGNHRIQVFHPNGTFAFKFGSHGDADGEFDSPEGVAFDGYYGETVIVADTGNHRIQGFSLGGEFLYKFGSHGDGILEFDGPRDVVYDNGFDRILVADTGNDRIEAIDLPRVLDGHVWKGARHELSIGMVSTEDNRYNKPRTGVHELDGPRAVDVAGGGHPERRLAIADTGNDRIQHSAQSGSFHTNFGSVGTGAGEFWSPSGVAVGGYGQFAVADTGNHRVQVFRADRAMGFELGMPAPGPPPAPVAARALMCAAP